MKIKWFSVIRLIGLVMVLVYHFYKPAFPGGFIGVDVFFTFSGYLVTALFIDEYARTGEIDVLSFAKRRLYRIVPPLVLMILLVMPLALLVKRDFVADIGHQLAAVLGFMTNIYELATGGNYESQFIPHLFLHTWSLAIEVQFYLFWATVLFFCSQRGLKPAKFRGLVFMISLGLFTLSFLGLFVASFLTKNMSSLYFSSFFRSSSLFLGSLFATVTGLEFTVKRFRRNVELWSSRRLFTYISTCLVLLVLLGFALAFDHLLTYLFGFTLTSLFTGLLIYSLRVLHDKTPEVEEPVVFQVLSDLSYGIYLFHWPLYVIFAQLLPQLIAVILALTLSLGFATLSFYVLEPWLRGRPGRLFGKEWLAPTNKRLVLGVLGGFSLLTLGISLTAPRVGPFETTLLVNGLNQANRSITQTHNVLVGDVDAIKSVLILGDSVTLNSSQALTEALPDAELDAAISRSFITAYDNFENRLANDALAKTLVLAVGVNSVYNYEADIQSFIDALPDGHRLVVVTPYNITDGRLPEMRDYELSLEKDYPYVAIADWYQVAEDNPDIWAGSDGVHFSDGTDGAELYAKTIKKAVEKVAKKPAKGQDEQTDQDE